MFRARAAARRARLGAAAGRLDVLLLDAALDDGRSGRYALDVFSDTD
jgi:hypothetical protein